MKRFTSFSALLFAAAPAFASTCTEDMLVNRDEGNQRFTMQSGAIYEVLAGYETKDMRWITPQAVTTCLLAVGVSQRNTPEYEIINKHDNESIRAALRHAPNPG
ncbi:hypothetical protein [Paraburkholderia tropica]|uniref:hypothetical protein n=1 Tax=Paraburkholderia tropica TaxID=92647 RepID=UPI002AB252BF|nr:hypothetical protein [Paraburkholderia tropica]